MDGFKTTVLRTLAIPGGDNVQANCNVRAEGLGNPDSTGLILLWLRLLAALFIATMMRLDALELSRKCAS